MQVRILIVSLLLLLSTPALAVIDPAPDHMSIYFDETADVQYGQVIIGPISFYVILTNPTFAAVYGYEFGYDLFGNALHMTEVLYGPGTLEYVPQTPGNYQIGLAAPLATSEATVLARISVFVVDMNTISLTLTAYEPSSVETNTPAVWTSTTEFVPIRPAFFDDEAGLPLVCAYINDFQVSGDQKATWDEVKSLYR